MPRSDPGPVRAPPPAIDEPGKLLLWWILAGALVLRALLLTAWDPELAGDALDYDRLATSLAAGDGYVDTNGRPTSWRPPLYPAFLAGLYVAGGDAAAARWVQALLDVGNVALTAWIAGNVFGRRAALVAAVVTGVSLSQISASGRLLSETLFTFLLLVAVGLTVRLAAALGAAEGRSEKSASSGGVRPLALAAGAGVLLGLGTLTRGILILFPPVMGAALLLAPRGELPRRVRAAATLFLAFAAVLAPWAYRNFQAHGELVPVATQSGMTLYASYFPPEDRVFGVLPRDEVTRVAEAMSEAGANAFLARRTLEGIAADPGRLPRLTLLKALFFWVPLDWEILPVYGTLNGTYVLLMLLVGAWAALRRSGGRGSWRGTWPIWLPVAYLFVMALVFYGSPRMRLPAEPLIATFAGSGFVLIEERIGRRAAGWTVAATAVLILVAAAAIEPLKEAAATALGAAGIW